MLDGHLGMFKSMEQRIRLTKEAKTLFQQPYLTGRTQHQFEKNQVEKMLIRDVIEPTIWLGHLNSIWTS